MLDDDDDNDSITGRNRDDLRNVRKSQGTDNDDDDDLLCGKDPDGKSRRNQR